MMIYSFKLMFYRQFPILIFNTLISYSYSTPIIGIVRCNCVMLKPKNEGYTYSYFRIYIHTFHLSQTVSN